MDFARCSIEVPTAGDLLKVKELFEEQLEVVSVKNGYREDHKVKGSGYRDLKLLVKVDFLKLKLKDIAKGKTTMICEIQLICKPWLDNKITSSMSYKVLRANTFRELLNDFSKYLDPDNAFENEITPIKVLKNGWKNMAKAIDFSQIDASELLLQASQNCWEVAAADILVKKLGANLETRDIDGRTPASWCSRRGHSALLKTLIDLKANIHNADNRKLTALHHAVKGRREQSVQILLAAGASCSAKDFRQRTPLDIANSLQYNRIQKILKRQQVSRQGLKRVESRQEMDMLMTAVIEGSLADILDTHDLERSVVSQLFCSQAVAQKEENILQAL